MYNENRNHDKGVERMYAVGLMSGTSLDGIDAALCEIQGHGTNTQIRLVAFITAPLGEALTAKIKAACFKETSSVDLLCSLNFELGQAFSDAVSQVLKKAGMKSSDLSFIASHGQTVYHQPFADETHVSSTLQLGEASVIAYRHQCPVVSDFRVMDMAAGGQGAPLVPYSEFVLYSQPHKNIALLNLGGIGNVTWLDGSMDMSHIMAFDTGPGNMMINAAMKKLYGLDYDEDGKIAASGQMIPELLASLQADAYFKLDPPKSTGREWFGEDRTGNLVMQYQHEAKENIIHTLTYFTAWSVAWHVQHYLAVPQPLEKLIVGGGGAHNLTVMKMLSELLPGVQVLTQDEYGYHSDAKEAIAFVIMANETLHGSPSNVMSATGAKEPVILGKITPAPGKGKVTCYISE